MLKYFGGVVSLCFILAIQLTAQQINTEQLKGLQIRNIGPAGMSGRITTIDVDLSDSDIIYAGAASGGVWKSVNGGISWEPIFDDQPLQAIGSIKINQKNPQEIWVGTGEGNPRNSHNTGGGIYKSIDGGKTWKMMGLKNTQNIHRIIIHRDNPDVVYAGVLGAVWGTNKERGVYRTTDGGKNWKKILFVDENTGIADLVTDPKNPNKLIAAMWEFGRKPWTFNSGGPGSGMYVTYDGGNSWEKRTSKDGLPEGELGRMGLAIAPSSPNIVYALVEAKENALYKSTDGGRNWKKIAEKGIGNRPFYYSDIFVDPKNENRVYSLYSLVSRSEDGGKTFSVILPYSGTKAVHPDHHAFWVHPEDPNYIIEGNDGGLNISRDRGESWRFVSNIPVGQFYHVSYDMGFPYNIGGGMQDNGSWVGPAYVLKPGGIRNYDWQEVYFGDGFDVSFRPDNSRYVYAMSQGGNLGYVDKETGKSKFIKPFHPEGKRLRFNWNAAFAQNPFHDCGIFYGSQYLHKSMDCGDSWTVISPDLTTNDTTKQKQHESGGLTIDNTQAENHTTIIAISPSPVDENVIWVGTDDGNLQFTRDGGKSWTNLAGKLPAAKAGSWIPQIEVSRENAGEAFVVVNDYRRNDFRPMLFHTKDYGQSFKRIVDEEQVDGFVLSVVQDPEEPGLLWLGTDRGLYFSVDGGTNWNHWMNGFPAVQVSDLKIHPREHDLIVGTFGRSFWVLDDIRPFRELAKTKGKVLEQAFKAFPAPDAYLAEYRSYDGIRFVADAEFIGDNRPSGARLTLWVKPNGEGKEENAEGKKKMKVKVEVMNADNEIIRNYSTELDTGINRITWNLRKDGFRFPSHSDPRPGSNLPSGMEVLPGTYKLVFSYGDHKDSTMVKVLADPRLDSDLSAMKAKAVAYEAFAEKAKMATQAFDRLKETKKTIKRVGEALAYVPDSTKKAIAEMGKTLQDSIETLQHLYMDPPDTKGIVRTPGLLNSSMSAAYRYLLASDGAPNQAAKYAMQHFHDQLANTLERINRFFEHDFKAYQEKVEAIDYSLFKKYEALKLE